MKIKVEATTKQTRKTSGGSVYTGVKIEDGDWVNVYGNHVGKKGQMLDISEPKCYAGTGGTKWASVEKPFAPKEAPLAGQSEAPSPSFDPDTGPGPDTSPKKTLQQYFVNLDLIYLHVKKLEPDNPEARAMLTNNIMSLWAEGKII